MPACRGRVSVYLRGGEGRKGHLGMSQTKAITEATEGSVAPWSVDVSDLSDLSDVSPAATAMRDVTAPVRRQIPWREVCLHAAAAWVITRALFILVTYLYAADFDNDPTTLHSLVNGWNQWDAVWYARIAQNGYWTEQPTAFFPLYPALTHVASFLFGGSHYVAAALLVTSLAAYPAFVGLGALTANESWGARAPWRTIQITIAYPFAFFLFAPYTESLFLVFATFCLLFARRGNWGRAALLAMLATATRPTGGVLVLPVLWEYGRQHGWWQWRVWQAWRAWMPSWWRLGGWRELDPRRVDWRQVVRTQTPALIGAIVVASAAPLVIVSFMVYTWVRFGHPLLIFNVHILYWSRVKQPIWTTILTAVQNLFTLSVGDPIQERLLGDLAALVIIVLLTLFNLKRMPVAFTLYMLGVLYLTVSTPVTTSPDLIEAAGRFLLVSFPIFMIVGRYTEKHPWLETLIMSGGFLLQAIFAVLFLSHILVE